MGYLRPSRIVTTDEAIRDAVMAEMVNHAAIYFEAGDAGSVAGTIAQNVVQRLTAEPKPSDITGFPEDDDQFAIVTNSPDGGLDAEILTDEGWEKFQSRRFAKSIAPGQGPRKRTG
jgi:hypothetical protein